jgi:hypothetical protein
MKKDTGNHGKLVYPVFRERSSHDGAFVQLDKAMETMEALRTAEIRSMNTEQN